jgi:PAS domain S-box-containing protein
MSHTGHMPELESLRSQVADLTRALAEQDRALRTHYTRLEQERACADAELRRQLQQLSAVQALAHVGGWEWDIASGEMEWSDEQFRIFGHEPQSISPTHETFLTALLPEDHDRMLASINDALQGRVPYNVDCRIVLPDGEVRTIHCRGEVDRDADGRPVRMFGSTLDITERKQAEAALQQSEAHFRELIEHSSDIITVLDLDGTIRFESPSFERLLGYAAQELNGRVAFDFVHEDDLAAVLERFETIVRQLGEPRSAEFRFRHKDGSWRTFEGIGRAVRDAHGQIRVIVNSRDITERKRVEEILRQSRQQLHAIVEGTSDAVFIKDLEGRYLLFNAAAGRFVGKKPEDVLGHDDTFIFPPDDARAVMEKDRDVMANGKTATHEDHVTTADGTHRTFLSTKGPLFDAEGAVSGLFGISRDITERKQTEDRLRTTQYAVDHAERIGVPPFGLYKARAVDDVGDGHRPGLPAGGVGRLLGGVQEKEAASSGNETSQQVGGDLSDRGHGELSFAQRPRAGLRDRARHQRAQTGGRSLAGQ